MTKEDFERAEFEEVRRNLRNYGDVVHPDDMRSNSLYLREKYLGTGLSAFLRRIEGKPPKVRRPILDDLETGSENNDGS